MIGEDWLRRIAGWGVHPNYAEFYEDNNLVATIKYYPNDNNSYIYWTIYHQGMFESGSTDTLDAAVQRVAEAYPNADPCRQIDED